LPTFIPCATKATLERARKAKELLKNSSGDISDLLLETQSRPDTMDEDNGALHSSNEPPSQETTDHTDPQTVKDHSGTTSPSPRESQEMVSEAASNVSTPSYNSPPSRPPAVANPYLRSKPNSCNPPTQNSRSPRANQPPNLGLDKQITLKKGAIRNHIHRYTLRIKIISTKSEEEEQILIQKTLLKFFNIVLQADQKSIIPPFLI
jgi:hypothetical protein